MALLSFSRHNNTSDQPAPRNLFGSALEHIRLHQPLSPAEQQAASSRGSFIGQLIEGCLDTETSNADEEQLEAVDKKTKLYELSTLKSKLNFYLNPLQAGTGRKHVLLYTRIDDYDVLSDIFGTADAEDEFLVPAAGILKFGLPAGSLAARSGNDIVSFVPDTDLITILLQTEVLAQNAAAISLPRTVDGLDHLGLSFSLAQIRPLDDFDHQLTLLEQELTATAAFGPHRVIHGGQTQQLRLPQ